MGIVSPSQSNAGETIEASDINNPINQLAAVMNGGIDATNIADSSITTAKLANVSVTPSKLNLGSQTATVLTDQSTASTTFADLATVGPSVTITVGPSGMALVILTGGLYNNSVPKYMSYAVSGATTVVASDTSSMRKDDLTPFVSSIVFLHTGLTPGANTFTMKYRTTSGTGNFFNRQIAVIPL